MVGAAGMIIAITTSEFTWPLWAGILLAFAVAIAVGFFNGYIVVKTGLPSFIVTLGMLFALRGATIGLSRLITDRTQLSMWPPFMDGFIHDVFAGQDRAVRRLDLLVDRAGRGRVLRAQQDGLRQLDHAARAATRPRRATSACRSSRVKILGFVGTATAAALLATIQVMDAGSADVLRGNLLRARRRSPRPSSAACC